jgi:hypothetical protein
MAYSVPTDNIASVKSSGALTIIFVVLALIAVGWMSVLYFLRHSGLHLTSALTSRNPYRAPQPESFGVSDDLLLGRE